MPHIIDVLKRLISCPQFVGKILLTCILFTDRVILAAYHCIEEHNFNCKPPVGVASPLLCLLLMVLPSLTASAK